MVVEMTWGFVFPEAVCPIPARPFGLSKIGFDQQTDWRFFTGTFRNYGDHAQDGSSLFALQSNGSVQVVVNSAIIPEPQEYTLIFRLVALPFVILCRQMQKKRHKSLKSRRW